MNGQTDTEFLARLGEIPDPTRVGEVPALSLTKAMPKAGPSRRVVRNRRLAALAGSAAWIVTHLSIFGIRGDLHELPFLYVAGQVLVPFIVAVCSLLVALLPGKLGLGLKVGLIAGLALLGPASFCLFALGAPVPHAPPTSVSNVLGTLLCFDLTVAWAAVPILCAVLSLRGAFAAGARWRSALVGAGAGLFAGATMNLHCSNVTPTHVLLGHGIPVILATLLGGLFLAARARA